MRTRMVWAIAAAIVLTGCSAQDQSKLNDAANKVAAGAQQAASNSPQTSQQGAQTVAQGLQQMAQTLQQAAQTGPDGKPIQPVDFEKLTALLPAAPDGWQASKPEGQTISTPVANSNADATYTKGNLSVKVQIVDTAASPLLMGPLTMIAGMGVNERSSSGYKRSSTVNGQLHYEELNSDDKHAEMTNLVNKRFIVKCEGNGMDTMDPVKQISDLIDLNKLAALK